MIFGRRRPVLGRWCCALALGALALVASAADAPRGADRLVEPAATPQQLGYFMTSGTEDPASSLGQAPLLAPSVFNFFRPGYTPPQSVTASKGLVAPEMQIASETSVLGYANFMSNVLRDGWGPWHGAPHNRSDVAFDWSSFTPMANRPSALLDEMSRRLIGKPLPEPLQARALAAIESMGNNESLTEAQRLNRVRAAALLVTLSPDYLIQR